MYVFVRVTFFAFYLSTILACHAGAGAELQAAEPAGGRGRALEVPGLSSKQRGPNPKQTS